MFNIPKIFNKHNQKNKIELNPRVIAHYGIPSTASCLAYDPIQQLLAVATLDGRIKVIGSDTIEGLLTSPKEIPIRNLEFLQNQGFLISVSKENDVQVWDLDNRCITSTLQWKSNITAFGVIQETTFMYVGDEFGSVSVLKYDVGEKKLLQQPYSIPVQSVSEAAGIKLLNHHSVVGVLPQPCSSGNRVLLAYDYGVLVLWDVTKDELVLMRGHNSSSNGEQKDQKSDAEDKQIVSLCWASLDGSIIAVGYTDGDIFLWNLSGNGTVKDNKTGKLVDNVVKIQLPSFNNKFLSFFTGSSNKRSPVVGLHWSSSGLNNDHGGYLFVYGGDEIGSAEVLTILSFEWSPQKDALKNVVRVNISLQGSYLDMILLHSFSVLESTEAASLFILSNPGQLQFYDSSSLSGLVSQKDKSCTLVHYRSALPTTEPNLTVGRFVSVQGNTKCSVAWSEKGATAGVQEGNQANDKVLKWPLNGGVPCHTTIPGEKTIERLYIAGYQDGSVRMWDATYPLLSPLFTLDPEVKGVSVSGVTAPVSALDFCSETLFIAIGSESGLVRLYNLSGNNEENDLLVVTETKIEVCDRDQGKGSPLSAVFNLDASPVSTLRHTNLGTRLAVGYKSGQVAMLNITPPSALFLRSTNPGSNSPVISLAPAILQGSRDTAGQSESQGRSQSAKELICALRSDMHVAVLDGSSGSAVCSFGGGNQDKESNAISLYILDGAKYVVDVSEGKRLHLSPPKKKKKKSEAAQISDQYERKWDGVDRSEKPEKNSMGLQILLCCTDVLQLYSLNSVVQGSADIVQDVKLLKTSSWTAIFKKDKKTCGLIVAHQAGSMEIRSLPNLEPLVELSLMPILRWTLKTDMDKFMSSTENGQITLVNGREFAVTSLLAPENDFRIPQSLPRLHDKTLAAALDMSSSSTHKKNKPSKILGGIMGGLKPSKESETPEPNSSQNSLHSSLEKVFSRYPAGSSDASNASGEVIELNMDNIKIGGPPPIDNKNETKKKGKKNDRKKLFGGATPTPDTKPRQRTAEEIRSQYRKESPDLTSAHAAALEARNKLLERQEKLEKLAQNSEELANGAQDYANMAAELKKRMKNRKWWQI